MSQRLHENKLRAEYDRLHNKCEKLSTQCETTKLQIGLCFNTPNYKSLFRNRARHTITVYTTTPVTNFRPITSNTYFRPEQVCIYHFL